MTNKMRDLRLVAMHRGGLLSREHHNLLISWAHDCAEHVQLLAGEKTDARLIDAMRTAKAWQKGEITLGDARKASVEAHTVARQSTAPAAIAIARAVGHTVATAHMADHSLRAAEYALKAVLLSGLSPGAERKWQDDHLPPGIREMVLSVRNRQQIFSVQENLRSISDSAVIL